MQQILNSDVILVAFSLLLGGLVGVFWERARADRRGGGNNEDQRRF
jgi:hypothetical protein